MSNPGREPLNQAIDSIVQMSSERLLEMKKISIERAEKLIWDRVAKITINLIDKKLTNQ